MASTEQVNIIIKAKDEATRQLTGIKNEMSSMTGAVSVATKAFVALGGAMALKSIIADTVQAVVEEERQWNRVTAALKSARFEYEKALPVIQRMTDSLEWQTGIADELIAQGFNRLLPIVRNVGDAYRYLQTASDIAAAKGVDLNSVVEALIAAHQGHYTMLERLTKTYFPDATKAAGDLESMMEQLNKQFAGQAKANMEGYAGDLKRFEIQAERFKENFGAPLLWVLNSIVEGTQQLGKIRHEAMFGKSDGAEDLAAIGSQIKSLTNEINTVITVTGSRRDIIPKALFGDDTETFAEEVARIKDEMLAMHNDLATFDIAFGQSEESRQLALRDYQVITEANNEWRRATEEATRAQQAAMQKVASVARQALSPLEGWIAAGQSIESTFAAMGQRIKQMLADAVINMLAEAIAKALAFKAVMSTVSLGGMNPIGGILQAGNFLLPFDNRNNDSMLQREVMWVGRLITRGLTEGMMNGLTMQPQQPQMAAAAPTTVVLQFNGPVTSEQFVNDTIIPAFERAAKNGRTQVKLNPTHLTGKRNGLSY